jgi:hypothetical protein
MLIIIWKGWKYMFNTCYLGWSHVVDMHMHSSTFAWKFHTGPTDWYNKHHTLPEKGYDAAAYP